MRGRVLTAIAAVILAATGLAAAPATAETEAPVAEPTTPVLSLRRVPGFLVATMANRRLGSRLAPVMEDAGLGGGRDRACLAVRDPDGRTVYSRNPTLPLIPASTMKMATATAAVRRLGPDFHYTTEVRAAAAPTGGSVTGDLWLVGAGDPLLATADFASIAGYQERPRLATSLETLADRVVAAGVRRVEGRIVGDESRYDTQRYVPTWNPDYATEPEVGPQSALTVNGGFVQWRPEAVPAPSPAANAAAVLTGLLRSRGVAVGGDGTEGRAPPGSTAVASIDSPPLSDVVAVLLQESDNLTAELLVKELGVRFGGEGSTRSGLEVVRSTIDGLGLPDEAMSLADGSGLDRSDRLTCELLQATLAADGEQGVVSRGLPVAGRNGTLARRFAGSPADGKVRAKTGSLRGVTGLSGWTTTLDGRSLPFSLLANDLPSDRAGTSLQDRVVSALATWPEAPAVAEVAPGPAAVPAAAPGP
jgi:D-alanyl-D-alanine carboxypeptidase/D-alanyl-D-alanine-endopeptidase (penicillin-binding protein 4)